MVASVRSMHRLPGLLLGAALLWWSAPGRAAAQGPVPGPSFEQVLSLRALGAPAMSPDGRSIAFTLRTTDWVENRYDTEIWVARAEEPPFQLTRTTRGSSSSVQWSPDGRWLGFVADRGEKQQVYIISARGGEARAATEAPDGVLDYAWSPDGMSIAYTTREAETAADKQRRARYGEFTVEDTDYRQAHLWRVDVMPSPTCAVRVADTLCARLPKARRLTHGEQSTIGSFEWSPDGRSIAIEYRTDPLINSSTTADLAVLDVATGTIRGLVTAAGFDGDPVWSPDGKWIAYMSAGGDTVSNYYRNGHLMRVPAGGGTPVRLAAGFDEEIGSYSWTPQGLFFLGRQGTRRNLYVVNPSSGAVRQYSTTPENIGAISFSKDGTTLALLAQTPTTLPEIYRATVVNFRPAPLTEMTAQVASWGLVASEVVSWTSRDGTRIEGVLHKPKDFNPRRQYPLLVLIHGGPTGVDTPQPIPSGVYPVVQWLAKGALVLRPNYRGSTGYGEKFRSLNVRNLGVGDAEDVLSGVDHLVRQGIVDTTRIGAMGWSQGGYISAFLTTTSTRFKAISVGAGISDWMTYYVNTDIHPFTRQYLKATPWSDPEIYAKTSPITYVKQARTPTLIQHGELDPRVPIANARELYQALSDVGVPTRLVVYKGFGHSINRPKEQLAAMWHNWQWFARYLWGEDVPLPLGER